MAAELLQNSAVLKLFVISTALALSLGHHAALLCLAWCQPEVAAENHCHENAPAASTGPTLSASSCCDIAGAPAVFTSSPRSHLTVDAGAATLVSPLPPLGVRGSAAYVQGVDPSPPLDRRPQITVLRL
jgi:hypothetical protein